MLVSTDFVWLDRPEWTRDATEEEQEKYNCEYVVSEDAPEIVKKAFYDWATPIIDPISGELVTK